MKEKEIDIRALVFPEVVRKRPGQFIGSTEVPDVILREVIDNSIDEMYGSLNGNFIDIQLNTSKTSGWYVVSDNGRGIPIIMDPDRGITKTEMAVGTLNAGSKFSDDKGVTTGLNGVGVSCNRMTNLLTYMDGYGSIHIKPFCEVESGSIRKVLSQGGNWIDSSDPIITGESDEFIKIVTEFDSVIELTPDHLVLTEDGYKRADQLSLEDVIIESTPRYPLSDCITGQVVFEIPLVYKILCKSSGKYYIGSTASGIHQRFYASGYSHRARISQGYKGNLYSEISKYGVEDFVVEILYSTPKSPDAKEMILPIEDRLLKQSPSELLLNTTTDADPIRSGSARKLAVEYNRNNNTSFFNKELLREIHKKQKSMGVGFYDPEVGKRGRDTQKKLGIGLYRSMSQEDYLNMHMDMRYQFIRSNLERLDGVEVTEKSWNEGRHHECVTYLYMVDNLDKLVSKGVISEDESKLFKKELCYEYSDQKVKWDSLELHDKKRYTATCNLLNYLRNGVGICETNYSIFKNNIPLHYSEIPLTEFMDLGLIDKEMYESIVANEPTEFTKSLESLNIVGLGYLIRLLKRIVYGKVEGPIESLFSYSSKRDYNVTRDQFEEVYRVTKPYLNEIEIDRVDKTLQ